MVGTFYRASSPTAEPYVREGDVVKEGQILCIIEAMKLMNEIETKAGGRIAKILVENGQPSSTASLPDRSSRCSMAPPSTAAAPPR